MFFMPSTHKHETKTIKGGKLLIANHFDQSIACIMFFANHITMHQILLLQTNTIFITIHPKFVVQCANGDAFSPHHRFIL